MDRLPPSRNVFWEGIRQFKSSAKPSSMNADSSQTDCRKALDQVTDQMMELVCNPKAIYHQDFHDNPIVTVPNVGSLMLTQEGLQMALLKSTIPLLEQVPLSTKTKYEGVTVDYTKSDPRTEAPRTVISYIQGHITESAVEDREARGSREDFILDGSVGATPVHQVQELGYQFADHVQGVFSKGRELEIPNRPLFESPRW